MQPGSPPIDSIQEFVALMRKGGVKLDVADLMDVLWLADQIQSSASTSTAPLAPPEQDVSPTAVPSASEPTVAPVPPALPSPTPLPPSAAITSPTQVPEGFPLQVPAAPSIRSRLDLSRAMRPLMRKIPSPTQRQFNETATVTQYAEQEILSPVLSPSPERWFDLALVIEAHPSTFLWENTIAELHQILGRQGAFRQINTWQLQYQSNRIHLSFTPQGVASPDSPPRNPEVLCLPTQRQLIWIVSDCTSDLWQQRQLYEWLHLWGKTSPLSILQLLPERLWDKSILGRGLPVEMRSHCAGLPNAKWTQIPLIPGMDIGLDPLDAASVPAVTSTASSSDQDDHPESRPGPFQVAPLTVPVITLEPEPMRALARVITGHHDTYVQGVTINPGTLSESSGTEPLDPDATAVERVRKFQTNSSPTARKLAGMLAAVPVSLSVIQLIRQTLLPQSRQVHIAEVYMSGLLAAHDPPSDRAEADQAPVTYDFAPGVRKILLDSVFQDRIEAVLDAVSGYISARLNLSTRSFEALIAQVPDLSPEDQETVIPFAQIATQTLRQMGGYYKFIADQIDDPSIVPPEPEPLPPVSSEDCEIPPLRTLVFDRAQLCDPSDPGFPPVIQTETGPVATLVRQSAPSRPALEFTIATVVRRNGAWEIERQAGSTTSYYSEPLPRDQHLEMIGIPGGTFLMGSPSAEKGRYDRESPQHEVTLAPFFLGRYPVTQAQWRAVAQLPEQDRGLNPDPSIFEGALRPVEGVSWHEAIEFCARLSVHTGREYRLPSESEWEYACRAGSTTPFHFGAMITSELANYNHSIAYGGGPTGSRSSETTPVDHFGIANAFGVSDMHGNVYEWCQDNWYGNYTGAPTDGSAWLTKDESAAKIRRGGYWLSDPKNCRSASRFDGLPVVQYNFLGFRVACVAPRT